MARILLLSLFDEYALGNRSIAASLVEAGHEVRLLFLKGIAEWEEVPFTEGDEERVRATLLPVRRRDVNLVVEAVTELNPDLAGISLVSNSFGLAVEMSRVFREELNIPVVWGGVEPTISPERAEPHADAICIGEGERGMVELARRLDHVEGNRSEALMKMSEPVENLRIRRDDGWLTGREGVMVEDIDRLPFPLFDPTREVYVTEGKIFRGEYPPGIRVPGLLPAISFRGCPYKCTYCCHSVLKTIYSGGKYLRRRSVDTFIAELKERKERFPELRMLEFEDDVFTLDQDWIDRFCEEYRKFIGLPFWCYTYPGIARESMLVPLREAGLSSVTFGIQSGSRRVLEEVYNRPVKVEDMGKTAAALRKLGIPFVVDVIGGNPLETDEDRIETVRVLTSLPKPYLLHPVNPLSFYPKLPITERAREAGVRLQEAYSSTVLFPPELPEFRAWDAIYELAHYPGVEFETLRPFWEDGDLLNRPEPLEQLARSFRQAAYAGGSVYETKDDRIQKEGKRAVNAESRVRELEGELARLRGSRLVRWALRVREMLEGGN